MKQQASIQNKVANIYTSFRRYPISFANLSRNSMLSLEILDEIVCFYRCKRRCCQVSPLEFRRTCAQLECLYLEQPLFREIVTRRNVAKLKTLVKIFIIYFVYFSWRQSVRHFPRLASQSLHVFPPL